MDHFKSFNEFRKDQHGRGEARLTERVPESPISVLEESRKKAKKKKIHHASSRIYVFGTAAAVSAVFLALFFLPVPLGNISLSGTEALTAEDVLFEGRIRQPVNVLQVSSSELAQRLSKDIRVEEVTVSRKFPFTLEVDIKDRKPLGIIQDEFGYAFVDKTGMVMDTAPSINQVDVPLITGKRMGNLLLGDTVASGELEQALDFLNHLSPEGLKVFSEVNIGNSDNIKAYTRDGITVRLGSGNDMAGQAQLAENMVGDVKARGLSVEYIDANPGSPFIKLKK